MARRAAVEGQKEEYERRMAEMRRRFFKHGLEVYVDSALPAISPAVGFDNSALIALHLFL